MSRRVSSAALPEKLSVQKAVELAYAVELERSLEALRRGLPVLVECDKELTPFFYRSLRQRLRQLDLKCDYLDGRPRVGAADSVQAHQSLVGEILRQLREAVRGPAGGRVVVLPHLDVLTSTVGGPTAELREIIPLLYENADIVWLGFEDPSFAIPPAIERLFPHRETIAGVRREQLPALVTQAEARVLGGDLDTYVLYECVSGMNVVRLRRVLSALAAENGGPAGAVPATSGYEQLRAFTLGGAFRVPDVDLQRDIGGYPKVKERLAREIIDVIRRKDALVDDEAIARLEAVVPRGLVIWGPPGTGKTLFAEALAAAIGAAVLVASGPELRTRWMVESTENVRQLFVQARRSAPSLIVIDEIDAFASARSPDEAGVEHAMVKQLRSEMDALRPAEMVFVVGITRQVHALEATLLRPGRFEFHVHVPYPDADNRSAILRIHDAKLRLAMSDEALEHAVRSTAGIVEGSGDARYSGDHLQALCRQMARRRLREELDGPTTPADVDAALEAYLERPQLSDAEQHAVATHEAGHAICALHCEHAPPIDRISIRGDLGALGYVRYESATQRYLITRGQVLDIICILFGGREAEQLLLSDVSTGAGNDISRATELARVLVEDLGMGAESLGARAYSSMHAHPPLADATRAALDEAVGKIVDEQRLRARAILKKQRAHLEVLRDALIRDKVLDAAEVTALLAKKRPRRRRKKR
jgi:cell division protease FtsH